ncbi:DUF2062 domain-containing protein [Thalassotalea crassostreae]|uniref:DUF2062 domain-containing protein n=1 Tax=Thalassotalea crassostreae TaxID=1763536 RepID=UPI000838B38C|nr:DUF2062 domain-containing protein [Thalassotalea crassostreae]
MPKKLIKRWLPDHQTIKTNKHLQIFGDVLHDANLWHLNRRSVAKAFAIGLFFAFIPVPFQMMLAAGMAILAHGNLPLSVALVWISNPITIPPIFYACYKLGTILLNEPPQEFAFELSWQSLTETLANVGGPFLLGCGVAACFFSILGYTAINLIWRISVRSNWNKRSNRK